MDEASKKNTHLIFNLDIAFPLHGEIDQDTMVQTAIDVIEDIDDLIAGVTVNRCFGDSVGILGMERIIKRFDVPFIADYNLCDIDRNVLWMASELYEAGFQAITVPAFIGKEPIEALKDEFPEAGLIVTLSLPHEKKSVFMDKAFKKSAELAEELNVDGVSIAGNHPEDLKKANKYVKGKIVICDGFEQGKVSPGDCLKEEGNFETVGSIIYESKDPRQTAIRIREEQKGDWDYNL